MSPRRVGAVARRIVAQFRRDHRSLALLFIVPIVVVALLGWIVRGSTEGTTHIVIANEAGMVGERVMTALEDAAAGLDPAEGVALAPETLPDADAARDAVAAGEADLAIVLPAELPDQLTDGQRPTLVVVTEGTDPAGEAALMGDVQRLVAAAAGDLLPGGGVRVPEIVRETVYLDPAADQLDVIAPVFLGFFAYFFVFILTGISFLRERIGGTLERLLATPVTRPEIVTGYILGFGLFATLQVLVLTAFVLGELQVPAIGPLPEFTIGLGVGAAGNPLMVFVIALLLAMGAVSLGILLSTFARTELQILQFIPLVIVPQALLSGIFWPVERLPEILQPAARLLPLTYAVDGLREVMLKGADLTSAAVRLDLMVLAAVAGTFLVLATLTIHREIA